MAVVALVAVSLVLVALVLVALVLVALVLVALVAVAVVALAVAPSASNARNEALHAASPISTRDRLPACWSNPACTGWRA